MDNSKSVLYIFSSLNYDDIADLNVVLFLKELKNGKKMPSIFIIFMIICKKKQRQHFTND